MPEFRQHNIRENSERVRAQIEAAAESAGRDPDSVRLVVVTKTHPVEVVTDAVQAGVRIFGENYAEEAVEKIAAVTVPGIEWHMIGHVQSRKARLVAENFNLVHSLDSLKLAQRLDRFAAEAGRRLPVLVEFNVSGESSKYGWAAWDREYWPALVEDMHKLLAYPGLEIRGLMTMPPFADLAIESRPYFEKLAFLQAYLRDRVPGAAWDELSMGTSVDFTEAVRAGATLVRIGTAILGARIP